MRKTTIYSFVGLLAILVVGISALQVRAGQEEGWHLQEDWHHREHRGDDMHRHAPVVVYEHAFKGQAASIPLTTLFTPGCNCMYRVTVYQEQPNIADTLDLGLLTQVPYLSWTDDFAQRQTLIRTADGTEPLEIGKPAYFTHEIVVHSVANQPIQFTTLEDSHDHSTYDMYVVVEEL